MASERQGVGGWDATIGAVFEDVPMGIAISDSNCQFIRVNQEAVRLVGFEPSPTCPGAFIPPTQSILRDDGTALREDDFPCVRACRRGEHVRGEEIGLLKPDGNLVWVSVSTMPLPSGGAIVFYQDVTARRRHDDVHRARGRLVELATQTSTHDLLRATLDETEALTGSLIGFYHFLDDDQVTLSLQAWSTRTTQEFCHAEGKGRHYDLGEAGIWVDCIHQRKPVIHNDYEGLTHKRGLPEGHARVVRLLTVPVMRGGKIKALLGVGNKPRPYGPWDVDRVQYLADLAWDIAERRRAEEALHLKEAALDSSLGAVALSDMEGRLRYVNNAFIRLWRLPNRNQALGQFARQFWADSDAAEHITQKVAAGEIPHSEMLAQRPDGSTFEVEYTACTVRDRAGQAIGLLGTFVDSSERHLAQQALKRSEERFATALNFMHDAIYIADRETGVFIEVNKGFERMSGYSREETLGKNVHELGLLHEHEDRERFRQVLQSRGQVRGFLCQIRHRNGSVCWGETSADPIVLDGRNCQLCSTRDVTARIQSEQALRQSEERLRSMFDKHDAVMLLLDAESGRILQANDAAERYYGYPPGELGRMNVSDLNALGMDDIEAGISRALAGEQRLFHRTHRLASGETRDVEIHSSPIAMDDKSVLFAIVHDVTDRRKLEDQVRQAQKMESLGSLAGGVAHDMNNILGAILGITSLLREDDADGRHTQDYETLIQACLRGRTMVRGLLDFTRQELVDLQPLDLNQLAEEQIRLMRSNLPHGLRMESELATGLRPIRGDSNTLGRAVMNLLINAVDAISVDGSRGAGRITVRTRNTETGAVELVVEDDGPGMTKDVLDKALDPFFTTKAVGKGTGLGLAIVYGTMKAHHGQLEITSQPGRGVRACLRFPAGANQPSSSAHASKHDKTPPSAHLDVLLVDDDPLIQSAVSGMLRRLGHRVTSALTGAEALKVLQDGARCSVVILDLNMPVLDGPSTLPRLRSLRPTLPVIIATGRADAAAQELARRFPAVTILPKPFAFEELREQICAVVP